MPSDTEEFVDSLSTQPNIQRVSMKIPPFWDQDPELWFAQLEAQFSLAGISTHKSKFNYVLGNIEQRILRRVADIVQSPPDDPYTALKNRLIDTFSSSEAQRLRQLVENLPLGDKQPSVLFNEMKHLANGLITDDVLLTMWRQRLPPNVATICETETTGHKVLQLADRVNTYQQPSCSYIHSTQPKCQPLASQSNDNDELIKAIAQLSQRLEQLEPVVNEIKNNLHNNRSNYNSNSLSRSRSKTNNSHSGNSQANGICYYHNRFGKNATKCQPPCKFEGIVSNSYNAPKN